MTSILKIKIMHKRTETRWLLVRRRYTNCNRKVLTAHTRLLSLAAAGKGWEHVLRYRSINSGKSQRVRRICSRTVFCWTSDASDVSYGEGKAGEECGEESETHDGLECVRAMVVIFLI